MNFVGEFSCIPNKVKWLKWEGCPFKSLPSDLNLQEVVVLDLSSGMISEVWNQDLSTMKVHLVKVHFFIEKNHCFILLCNL